LRIPQFLKNPFVCIQPYNLFDLAAPVSKVSSPERCE